MSEFLKVVVVVADVLIVLTHFSLALLGHYIRARSIVRVVSTDQAMRHMRIVVTMSMSMPI